MVKVGIISNITNSSLYKSIKSGTQAVQQKFYDFVPDKVMNNDKFVKGINWIGSEISSAENRLILGATALMSQPFIDARNKNVDADTRKVSVCRTVAKILVGTMTGFAIRKGCIKAIKAYSKLPSSLDKAGKQVKLTKLNTFFSPTNAASDVTDSFKQYRNALGTVVALFVMSITNFLIDAPLTNYFTNKFVKHAGGTKNETSK